MVLGNIFILVHRMDTAHTPVIHTHVLHWKSYSIALSVDVSLQVQCNVFEGASGEVALTAAGGLRQLPGLTETYENAALVCTN